MTTIMVSLCVRYTTLEPNKKPLRDVYEIPLPGPDSWILFVYTEIHDPNPDRLQIRPTKLNRGELVYCDTHSSDFSGSVKPCAARTYPDRRHFSRYLHQMGYNSSRFLRYK